MPTGTLTKKTEPPGTASDVEVDQDPTEHLAGQTADGDGRAVDTEGPGAAGAAEPGLDDAQRLGHHRGGADALEDARGDQGASGRRDAAEQGREGEGDEAGHEQPA